MTIGKLMTTQVLNKTQFSHLIPHAGSMSLIDCVESWTDTHIHCTTKSHLAKDNPLRLNNHLSTISLIEYGAQSMAIHGGLLSGHYSPGYLAAVRAVHFYIDNLNTIKGILHIKAETEFKIAHGAVYAFSVSDEQHNLLLEARATVIHTQQ